MLSKNAARPGCQSPAASAAVDARCGGPWSLRPQRSWVVRVPDFGSAFAFGLTQNSLSLPCWRLLQFLYRVLNRRQPFGRDLGSQVGMRLADGGHIVLQLCDRLVFLCRIALHFGQLGLQLVDLIGFLLQRRDAFRLLFL